MMVFHSILWHSSNPILHLPAEERPVGGLGIFLISQIMDEMNYEPGKNNQHFDIN
jgi:anti-sigma regulatory factor (Ser/Thr protein kinase)